MTQGWYEPHLWYLPNPIVPAIRCTFPYAVTKDFKKHCAPVGVAGTNVGTARTVQQEDVADGIFLNEYPLKYVNEWPQNNKDPRLHTCRYRDRRLHSLWEKQEVLNTVKVGEDQPTTRTCDCTFAQLQAEQGLLEFPALELIEDPTFGKGVRILQAIKQDQYLGIYKGEMYPKDRKDGKAHIS